jgi:PHD/YefM family antitoxin component YafN of YafNO toxin-antitoxin module
MPKAVTANKLKTQMGRILRALGDNERFVILRRNRPVGVLLSVHQYVKDHPDQYEDVEDFIDTLLEESDPEFQRSLKRGAREARRGHYLSHIQLKVALANQRLR